MSLFGVLSSSELNDKYTFQTNICVVVVVVVFRRLGCTEGSCYLKWYWYLRYHTKWSVGLNYQQFLSTFFLATFFLGLAKVTRDVFSASVPTTFYISGFTWLESQSESQRKKKTNRSNKIGTAPGSLCFGS